MLTLITSFFKKGSIYLTVNFLSAVILLGLSASLPTKAALTPVPFTLLLIIQDLVLTKTKVKIARLASYFSVFLGAIAAIIVSQVSSTSKAGLGVIIGLVVLQIIITIISTIVAKVT